MEDEDEEPVSLRKSAILFARDVAVAFLVVGIVLGLLFAYTQVWPPMVVIESRSMQHSDVESAIGVIDTGDLVLVQDVRAPADVVTWIEGRATGHRTYSDFGDVIIFLRPGQSSGTTPVIHRAYAFVTENTTRGSDVPSLEGLPPGTWDAVSAINGTRGPFAYGIWQFTLTRSGWQGDRSLTFNGTAALAQANVTSGFMTKGDNNPDVDNYGAIEAGRILGKARGELPWFGLIKLTFWKGLSGCCCGWGDTSPSCGAPRNSWDALLISLILIIVGPFVLDYGWGWYRARRKARLKAMRPATEPATSDPFAPSGSEEAEPSPEPDSTPEPEPPADAGEPAPDGVREPPPVTDEAQKGSAEPEDDDL